MVKNRLCLVAVFLLSLGAVDGLAQSAPPAEPPPPPTTYVPSAPLSLLNPTNENQSPGPRGAWFAGVNIGVVDESFTRINTPGPARQTFLGQLHSFALDWAVAPEVVLGYRLEGGGELFVNYRYLSSSGTHHSLTPTDGIFYTAFQAVPLPAGQFLAPDPAFNNQVTHGQLEENWLDVDFALPQRFLSDSAWWRLSFGLRMANLYANFTSQYDFKANLITTGGPPPVSFPFSVNQGASNQSFAIGPHIGLDGAWRLGTSGLSLVGRGDAGILGAANRQTFDLTVSSQTPGVATPTFTMPTGSATGPGYIVTLNLEGGLNWTIPLGRRSLNLALGYGVNSWMFTATGGDRDNALFSDINRLSHGPFFRSVLEF